MINNFTAHKLFNSHAGVMSNTFCYHTTNNREKPIDQEDKKNTAPITTSILTTIRMHIGLTKFLEEEPPEIEYNVDSAIHGRYFGLDWCDKHKEEIVEEVINKDDDNKTPKQKAR